MIVNLHLKSYTILKRKEYLSKELIVPTGTHSREQGHTINDYTEMNLGLYPAPTNT